MNIFKSCHPLVNFIYFIFIIMFSVLYIHPVCLGISFFTAFLYYIMLGGKKRSLVYISIAIALITFLNCIFRHEGVTVLAYFPDGNPFTLETLAFGIAQGFQTVNTVLWFLCFTKVVTTDKLMWIFGKIHPSLALVFSMTLRFIPRFIKHIKKISTAKKGIGKANILKSFSSAISWSAENSIDTSDSMIARGYGLSGKTSFSIYRFSKYDIFASALIIMSIFTILIVKDAYCIYFPILKFEFEKPLFFTAYFLFGTLPLWFDLYYIK